MRVTLKASPEPEGAWIVIRADTAEELAEQLDQMEEYLPMLERMGISSVQDLAAE